MAHEHGADPKTVAQGWKEAGVLRQVENPHRRADETFAPGYAVTVNINDPAKLDEVLAMADAAVRPVVLDLDPDTLKPVATAEGAALAA